AALGAILFALAALAHVAALVPDPFQAQPQAAQDSAVLEELVAGLPAGPQERVEALLDGRRVDERQGLCPVAGSGTGLPLDLVGREGRGQGGQDFGRGHERTAFPLTFLGSRWEGSGQRVMVTSRASRSPSRLRSQWA